MGVMEAGELMVQEVGWKGGSGLSVEIYVSLTISLKAFLGHVLRDPSSQSLFVLDGPY